MKTLLRALAVTLVLIIASAGGGCKSTYYGFWETFGKHKRDLLKDNVEEVRKDQQDAAEQFKDALTRLKELYQFEGGDLEKKFNRLQGDYDKSALKADAVRKRIQSVQSIARDLFAEWEKEIESMTNASLKSRSRQTLADTQRKFRSLETAMEKAEASMEPVLAQLRDQVLYLKHNLNAQAIGALRGETLDIEKEIAQLVKDMNASIAEADAFISAME